jgi:cobalt-zinc-cadmium efflux system outer membrane protein
VGTLDFFPPVPDLQQLTKRLPRNPEFALWATEVSLREAAVDLEKARRVPDLTVGGGYKRYSASVGENVDTYLVEASIALPIFNRNRAGIRAARHQASKSEEEQNSARVRLEIALAERYNALSSAYSRVTALRDTVLPGAHSAFDAVSEGYRLGRFGLLDVFDSQRTLFEARHEYLQAATDYHKAVVDVERLIGGRLDTTATRRDGDLP